MNKGDQGLEKPPPLKTTKWSSGEVMNEIRACFKEK